MQRDHGSALGLSTHPKTPEDPKDPKDSKDSKDAKDPKDPKDPKNAELLLKTLWPDEEILNLAQECLRKAKLDLKTILEEVEDDEKKEKMNEVAEKVANRAADYAAEFVGKSLDINDTNDGVSRYMKKAMCATAGGVAAVLTVKSRFPPHVVRSPLGAERQKARKRKSGDLETTATDTAVGNGKEDSMQLVRTDSWMISDRVSPEVAQRAIRSSILGILRREHKDTQRQLKDEEDNDIILMSVVEERLRDFSSGIHCRAA